MFFRKKYDVKPNQRGYLYRANKLVETLEPGIHRVSDWRNETYVLYLPTTARVVHIINQEILSKDNIAFRVSFFSQYRILNGGQFLTQFELDRPAPSIIVEFEQRLYSAIQVAIRAVLSVMDSEEINEKRAEIGNLDTSGINELMAAYGVSVEFIQLKDITFPKSIQDLFAKYLEAKIRAKSELENARTAVATARALKNASELMKGDENLKFIQYLDLLAKIAEKGKHTFIIGDASAGQLKSN